MDLSPQLISCCAYACHYLITQHGTALPGPKAGLNLVDIMCMPLYSLAIRIVNIKENITGRTQLINQFRCSRAKQEKHNRSWFLNQVQFSSDTGTTHILFPSDRTSIMQPHSISIPRLITSYIPITQHRSNERSTIPVEVNRFKHPDYMPDLTSNKSATAVGTLHLTFGPDYYW